MSLLLIIVILIVLFGGGGGYYYGHTNYGPGGGIGILGFVIVIAVVLYLFGGM